MESKIELNQLSDSVDSAISQTQMQINNLPSNLKVSIPLAAIVVTIGLQALFKLLMLWIPTAFIFWILYSFWGVFYMFWTYFTTNVKAIFQKYDKLSDRKKQLGQDTVIKLLNPLSIALAVIYIISAVILVLAKSGIIASDNFSVVIPLVTSLLLIVILIGGLIIYRRLNVSNMSEAVKLVNDKAKLNKFVKEHVFIMGIALLLFFIFIIFIYYAMPIWALVTSWKLFQVDAMWYKVAIVLALQILSFLLLAGYLTQQLAKTELGNNLSKLSGIKLRIHQLGSLEKVSEDQMSNLKTQYYKANKYRFEQQRMFCFIPLYVPILNEAFVKSKAK
jgi:hypothetical protein